jgi:uncharacterized protein involved in exopolysaccharide biosynthesis
MAADLGVERERGGVGLRELIDAARADRLLLSTIVLACLACAIAFAFLAPKTYRAEIVLLPVSQEGGGGLSGLAGGLGGLASLAGVSLPKDSGREETLALLQSKFFLGEFIRDRHLATVLLHDEWDAAAGAWKDADDPPSEADAVKYLLDRVLSISEDPSSSLVRLRIDWRDPELAVAWATELVERLNRTARSRAVERANKSISYLNRELPKTQLVEGRDALNRVLESQINTVMMANVTDDYALRVVDPAVVPDRDDFVRPQRLLVIAVGLLLGIALAGFVTIVRLALRR